MGVPDHWDFACVAAINVAIRIAGFEIDFILYDF
jgi:hypothetical protein